MSWPDGELYFFPQQSLVASLLISLVSTLLFFRPGGVLSHLNSLTRRFPRFPPRNLFSLVTFAVCSLIFAATDTVFRKAPISLELAESRILYPARADTRPRTSLVSFCTVHLRTICVARSLTIFCLSTTFGPDPGVLPGFWGLMVLSHQPIPRKGSGYNNNNTKTETTDALLSSKGS